MPFVSFMPVMNGDMHACSQVGGLPIGMDAKTPRTNATASASAEEEHVRRRAIFGSSISLLC